MAKEDRGFASMDRGKQREIASKGGKAAHQKGTAHEWTADEARSAGRKGGQVSRGGRGRLVASETPDGTPDGGVHQLFTVVGRSDIGTAGWTDSVLPPIDSRRTPKTIDRAGRTSVKGK